MEWNDRVGTMNSKEELEEKLNLPLVTMIVLSYNYRQYVLETLESAKAQTYKNTQLIIVDDGSRDDSVAVIERWLKRNGVDCAFIRHAQNKGICKSLNEALAIATGKYVSMVGSDDCWLPDKIAHQVQIMESQSDAVGVLYSDAFQIDENGAQVPGMFIAAHRNLPVMPQGQILDVLLGGNFIPGMTTLIRRECYNQVGLYDETLPWEDWDMWMRIARRSSFLFSPEPSAKYRSHPRSFSHSNRLRMSRDGIKMAVKQFEIGGLTQGQRSILSQTLLACLEDLCCREEWASLMVPPPGAHEVRAVCFKCFCELQPETMFKCPNCGIVPTEENPSIVKLFTQYDSTI